MYMYMNILYTATAIFILNDDSLSEDTWLDNEQ